MAWCCAAYPIIYAGTIAVKDMSLTRARAIVGVWCSGIGFVTGWSLVTFATKYAEAAGTHVFRFLHPAGARLRAYRFLRSVGNCNPSQPQ